MDQRHRLDKTHKLYRQYFPTPMQLLAELHVTQERYDEGELLLLEALDHIEGESQKRTASVVRSLVALYDAWGKPDKAAEWRAKLPPKQDAVASDPPADEKQDE